jgi:hypothetical protein
LAITGVFVHTTIRTSSLASVAGMGPRTLYFSMPARFAAYGLSNTDILARNCLLRSGWGPQVAVVHFAWSVMLRRGCNFWGSVRLSYSRGNGANCITLEANFGVDFYGLRQRLGFLGEIAFL